MPQVECLPTCQDQGAPKKPPIMALDYVLARCENFTHTAQFLLTHGNLSSSMLVRWTRSHLRVSHLHITWVTRELQTCSVCEMFC